MPWPAATQGALLVSTLCIGTSGFVSPVLAAGYVIIGVVYAVIDKYERGVGAKGDRRSLERFVLKQITMGILLYSIWQFALPITVHGWYRVAESAGFGGLGHSADALRGRAALILIVIAAYLFVIDGGTRIVRGILDKFPTLRRNAILFLAGGEDNSQPESEENVGEWIGILERVITLTFVLTGNFTAIAFVLTAKSIARFKELETSKDFAEYYLLGTSGSMISALGAGILVRLIFGL